MSCNWFRFKGIEVSDLATCQRTVIYILKWHNMTFCGHEFRSRSCDQRQRRYDADYYRSYNVSATSKQPTDDLYGSTWMKTRKNEEDRRERGQTNKSRSEEEVHLGYLVIIQKGTENYKGEVNGEPYSKVSRSPKWWAKGKHNAWYNVCAHVSLSGKISHFISFYLMDHLHTFWLGFWMIMRCAPRAVYVCGLLHCHLLNENICLYLF